MGAELAVSTVDELRERTKREGLHGGEEIRAALKESLSAALTAIGPVQQSASHAFALSLDSAALKKALRSAQTVGVKEAFSMLQP